VNTELTGLLAEIHRLQEEVERRREALREQFIYTLEGDRVRLAAEVRHIHRRCRKIAYENYLLYTIDTEGTNMLDVIKHDNILITENYKRLLD